LRFLSAAKRHIENVSGPSQFVAITSHQMTDIMTRDFGMAEEQIFKYEQAVGEMLLCVGDAHVDAAQLAIALDLFKEKVLKIHASWKSDFMGSFLKGLNPTPKAPPNPQSTTGDSSHQPPSQGSPGGPDGF
jgi:hypothetical protein